MRAKRIDANQNEIVAAFRKLNCSVFITSMVGKGFPDLVLGYQGHNYLIEIKDGAKPKYHQALTDVEFDFHYLWRGQVAIITSVADAIDFIKNL